METAFPCISSSRCSAACRVRRCLEQATPSDPFLDYAATTPSQPWRHADRGPFGRTVRIQERMHAPLHGTRDTTQCPHAPLRRGRCPRARGSVSISATSWKAVIGSAGDGARGTRAARLKPGICRCARAQIASLPWHRTRIAAARARLFFRDVGVSRDVEAQFPGSPCSRVGDTDARPCNDGECA